MNIRFYNARILTMEGDLSVLRGELWVQGNRITYVGEEPGRCDASAGEEVEPHGARVAWDREMDCDGNLIMPGFKNAHAHSAMTFLRSFADDLPLMDWLSVIFPLEDALRDEDVKPLVTLAVMEYLTSGITAAFDMYFCNRAILRDVADLGFRMTFCGSVNDFCGSVESLEEEYLRTNQEGGGLIRYQLGFHAEYTTKLSLLKQIAGLAEQYKAPVFTHNSESLTEVRECIGRHKMTPTALFDELGMFAYGGGGFHCVHLSEGDLDIFQRRGLSLITNPSSNAKLASGVPPLVQASKRGIRMAIGTDGPASNNCLDMFREMFLVTALQKLREEDASAMGADEVLRMATVGGAQAMGLMDCDVLKVGKLADLVVLDLHQPNMQPVHNVAKNVVYSGSKQNVKLTMVDGRILYEDGRFFIGEDVESVYRRVGEVAGNLV